MKLSFKYKYENLSDKEIVQEIITVPHNEEAATYLLYDRYDSLFQNQCKTIIGDLCWYEDCMNDLFIYLKGKNKDWHYLATFEWRSSLGVWLREVSKNRFNYLRPVLLGKLKKPISIDDPTNKISQTQIANDSEYDFNRQMQKILLLEAIGQLKDADQKYVVIKKLQGFSSKEIACFLQKKWERTNVIKFNNKGQRVVPDADYVNVRMQRAKENLKQIMKEI